MDWLDLQTRIDKGEDLHTEFKAGPIRPDELAAALVAFANTDGGQLIFGVTNDRRIAGVEDIDGLMQQVDNIAYQNCEPPLNVVQETVETPEGTVVVVHVQPQNFLPYAYISAARIPGEDAAAAPSDAKRIEGTLFDMLEDAARFLRLHLRTPHHIRGFEAEPRPELPEEALREVVVNALVHRDYTMQAPIRIFILDDRVEIRSPGSLPNIVTVEMIKAGLAHVLRNPLIYSFFRSAGLVTDTGNGVRRTILLVKKAIGLEPNIYEEGNETVVSLPRRQ